MGKQKITWKKHTGNPVVPVKPDSWRDGATMTADILTRGEQYYFYYTGKNEDADSIGLALANRKGFSGLEWIDVPGNPLISPGKPGSFDSKHCVDPAAVEFEGKLWLYYSAIGDGPDRLGLAVSEDWRTFQKHPDPILIGRAPEVLLKDGRLYLFYVLNHPKGGYEYHLAVSEDGFHFKQEGPVFQPAEQGWDSLSLVTARIFLEDGVFIMSYAGDYKEKDYPNRFGVAFSRDLYTWKRYPGNPVMESLEQGTWESRAVWFPEILKHEDRYYMYYEGNNGRFSQIGLATCDDPLPEIGKELL
jgi:predicted GH43/DUF377 family glycosyl hydrolase